MTNQRVIYKEFNINTLSLTSIPKWMDSLTGNYAIDGEMVASIQSFQVIQDSFDNDSYLVVVVVNTYD